MNEARERVLAALKDIERTGACYLYAAGGRAQPIRIDDLRAALSEPVPAERASDETADCRLWTVQDEQAHIARCVAPDAATVVAKPSHFHRRGERVYEYADPCKEKAGA